MPNIQIKNVPDEVHKVWKHRAVEAGQSLQEYLLAKITEEADRPTREEVVARIRSRSGGKVDVEELTRLIRQDRDSR